MTKLLDQAIRRLRDLPASQQEEVAARVLDILDDRDPWADLPPELRDSQLAAIKEGLAAIDRGDVVDHEVARSSID